VAAALSAHLGEGVGPTPASGLALSRVSAGYPGRPVLHAVNLSLRAGECVALVGPNGSGKSTVLKLLTNRLRPTNGEATLAGEPLARLGRFELARAVALVAQEPRTPAGFVVEDVVAMGRTPHQGLFGSRTRADAEVVNRALRDTNTLALAGRGVQTLSGGERQRVVLARALAQQARFLLLDEPTNHLDLRYQLELLAFARREAGRGTGVLLVLHDLNLAARVADRLVLLAGGGILADGPPQQVLDADLLRTAYGADVTVLHDDGVPVVVGRLPVL